MIRVQTRKLYRRWIEGVIDNSIIVYGERPHSVYPDYREVERLIQIDLWLFVLRIEWIVKLAPKDSTKEEL